MSKAEELIDCLEGEIAKRDEELAACRVAVENCELFRARIAELEQDLAYFPSTVRSLAETVTEREAEINQLRAELAELKAQEPVLPCELDLESSFSCAEKEASLHAGVRDTFYFALIECLQKNKLYRAPAQKELSVVMPERKKAHNCEGIEFWKANGWNDCLDELASIYAAPVSEAKAQGVLMPEQECKVFAARYICNWDGEGDICYALVEKHKDGAFIHIENGAPLIEYNGDKILNLWPLCLAAQAAPAADALVEALKQAFPLFDEDGLNELYLHCEIAVLGDRKRLHKLLATHSAKGVV